jgi:hypothetical protein
MVEIKTKKKQGDTNARLHHRINNIERSEKSFY